MDTPIQIEERLWDYIDGLSSPTEQSAIETLIAENIEWQQKYKELLNVHQVMQATELDAPSMRFSKNVMEEIAKLHVAPATKTYINKNIIRSIGAFFLARWSSLRQARTGKQFPIIWANIAMIVLLPVAVFLVTGMPLAFDYPVAGKFNLTGGAVVGPEFTSLLLALSFYTAAFIAETVRGAIRAVAKGQTEAANALGLHPSKVTRLIVMPQALRIIIPPLTNQYLNLTKNSSLAIAVGYADLFAVGGTILNQTGKAIEVILIVGMIYLILSLATSLFMNWFNAKMALVER